MPSFEIIYDSEDDALEITFATFDEHFARTIVLNDNIVMYTDLAIASAWGLSFYSYGQLLQVSETHLDGLRPLSDTDARRILSIIQREPVALFLQTLDPGELRALVKAPGLAQLVMR